MHGRPDLAMVVYSPMDQADADRIASIIETRMAADNDG
jgi:hypothetical protein